MAEKNIGVTVVTYGTSPRQVESLSFVSHVQTKRAANVTAYDRRQTEGRDDDDAGRFRGALCRSGVVMRARDVLRRDSHDLRSKKGTPEWY